MEGKSGCDQHIAKCGANQPKNSNDLKLLELDEVLNDSDTNAGANSGH